jgi:predicted RNA-binding protein (virulence factor B family)
MSRVFSDALLGRILSLTVRRFGPPGAFLAVDPTDDRAGAPTLLLPANEVPEGAEVGSPIDVFVLHDSEGRPIATTRAPKLTLGEVAFLQVTDVTHFGAFVDWGLGKELLVPYAEQTCELFVGDRHAMSLYLDDSGRLAATMRVSERLRERGEFTPDEWVSGEAWRRDDVLGIFVIVERRFVGRLPATEPQTLSRGEAAQFRVANVLPDGRIELSLRGRAQDELKSDAQRIVAELGRFDAPKLGDKSSPEAIRAAFGLSKKAFKRAAGHLLKTGRLRIDGTGCFVLEAQGLGSSGKAGTQP